MEELHDPLNTPLPDQTLGYRPTMSEGGWDAGP